LTGGAANRSNESIPFGHDFRVWRQARNINQAFGFRNSLFVKGSDPHRQGFDDVRNFTRPGGEINSLPIFEE
jgi:hypothetical protein